MAGMFGRMMRVRMGSIKGKILVAHWLTYVQNTKGNEDEYSVWFVRGVGRFTILEDQDAVIDRMENPELPLNFRSLLRGVPLGEQEFYTVLPAKEEVLAFDYAEQHLSGLPVWSSGRNGAKYLYHPGYDRLIPIRKWNEWRIRWENGEYDEDT